MSRLHRPSHRLEGFEPPGRESTQSPATGRRRESAVEGAKTGFFIALGLGGIEEGCPPDLFGETYGQARAAGLRVVAHAGETTGPRTIWGSLYALKAERIGHGVRCLDDPERVAFLRERQTPLEVCPTSNYCHGVVAYGDPHPLRAMVDAGLLYPVNLWGWDPATYDLDWGGGLPRSFLTVGTLPDRSVSDIAPRPPLPPSW